MSIIRKSFLVPLTVILVVLFLVSALAPMPVHAADAQLTVTMTVDETAYTENGVEKTLDSAPYVNAQNRVMAPIRAVAEAMGAKVEWNAETRAVTLTVGKDSVVFTVDSKKILVNGAEQEADSPVVIRNDRTMVPLRAAAEALGAIVSYKDGTATFCKADTLYVSTFDQLKQAVESSAGTVVLKDFDTTGETTTKLTVRRPVVLDGNGATVDFGVEVLSNGVTVKNFVMNISEFDKAVSAPGSSPKAAGDCIAIEIHSTPGGEPVIVENNTITHDIFGNKNSAIYLADGSHVKIRNNTLKVENKENNRHERGGIYIGAGVTGEIRNNVIDAYRTAFPMSPIGLKANLDALTESIEISPLVIKDNTATSIYITKLYSNGALFGEDGAVLNNGKDFGVRKAISQRILDLVANNTFTTREGFPVEGETPYAYCRLDLIAQGNYDYISYFHVENGALTMNG